MPGYEAEEHEVQTVWHALIGDRDHGEDPLARNVHLSSRQALISEVASRIADEQALIANELYDDIADEESGTSYAKLATRMGLSRSRAQQLIERAHRLHTADAPRTAAEE